jgi:alkylation response protein AidB-like acyl-CoA dehydrogenase
VATNTARTPNWLAFQSAAWLRGRWRELAGVGCARACRDHLLPSSPRQGRSAPHRLLCAAVFGSALTALAAELPSAVRVAAFQTLGNRIAKLAIQLEAAWLLVVQAACDFDNAEPRRFAWAPMAGVLAAESVTTDVLHFRGGYGFILEYELQLFFQRVKGWVKSCGDPQDELAALADELWPTKDVPRE